MNRLVVCLCALITYGSGTLESRADPAQSFTAAAGMYAKGAYADAERVLRSALEEAPSEPALLHALGLTLAKQGKYAEATLNLRRALRLAPRDSAAQRTLSWVRAQTSSPAIESPTQTLARALALVPREPMLWLAALLSLSATAWFVLAQRRGTTRRGGFAIAVAGLLLAAPPLASLALRAADDDAVILAPQVDARSGPSESDAVLFVAHAGQEVSCPESRAGWTRVVLPTGASGWLPTTALEPIAPH